MKNIYFVLSLGICFLMASCAKDDTNFDLASKEKITVAGLESTYTRISNSENLTINPTVSSTDPNAEFSYLWGMYETNVQGYAPVLDTIAKTKDLNYPISRPAKTWVLVYRVTNNKTGYSEYFTSDINVVTQYTRGWYVAKDDGSNTDLDLFLTPTTIMPAADAKLENVYSAVNGKKLAGKANMLTFFTAYKSMVTGVLGNTRTLFVSAENDISAVDINTLSEIHGFNTLFYEPPANRKMGGIFLGSSANYLINDGKCHSIYAMSANTGQFGVAKIKDEVNTPYMLSKYFLTSRFSDPYFFDENSSSFLSATGSGAIMGSVIDNANTTMTANHNNKTMLYMGYKSGTSTMLGYAVFQDKTDPNLKILSQVNPSKTAFNLVNDTLKTTDKLYHAERYALLDGDENLMYFSVGRAIYSRNLSNKFETLQFTVPSDEEITFIRHRKYTLSADKPFNYNFIMIGTKIGENYKIRMFNKPIGNLEASPVFTLEGKGIARDLFYIAPSVSESTYSCTY